MNKTLMRNFTKMLLIPTLVLGGLSACGYDQGARTNTYDGARPNAYDETRTYNYNGVRPYMYDGAHPFTNRNHSERVARIAADLAEDVAGVTRATAIVSGNDIVIGIDGNKRANLKTLERKVHDKVKAKVAGYNVHVTSDNRIHTRIRNIYTNMTNYNTNPDTYGRPMRDLGTDMADVIRDIGRTVTAPFR